MVRSGINEAIDPNKQLTFAVNYHADVVDVRDGIHTTNIVDIVYCTDTTVTFRKV